MRNTRAMAGISAGSVAQDTDFARKRIDDGLLEEASTKTGVAENIVLVQMGLPSSRRTRKRPPPGTLSELRSSLHVATLQWPFKSSWNFEFSVSRYSIVCFGKQIYVNSFVWHDHWTGLEVSK